MKNPKLLLLLASASLLFTSCTAINMEKANNPNVVPPNQGGNDNTNPQGGDDTGKDDPIDNPTDSYTVKEFDLFQEELPDSCIGSICNGFLRFRNTFKNSTALNATFSTNQDVSSSFVFNNEEKEKIIDINIDNLTFDGELGLSGFDLKDVSILDVNDIYGYLDLYGFKGDAKVDYASNRLNKSIHTKAKKEIYSKSFDFSDSSINAYFKNKNLYFDFSDDAIRTEIGDMLIDDDLIDMYNDAPTKFYTSLEQYLSSINEDDLLSAQNVLDFIYSMDRDTLEGFILIARSSALDSLVGKETAKMIKDSFDRLDVTFYSYTGETDKIVSLSLNINSPEDVDYLIDLFETISNDINEVEEPIVEKETTFVDFLNETGINLNDLGLKINVDFLLDGSLDVSIDNSIDLDYESIIEYKDTAINFSTYNSLVGETTINISFKKENYLNKMPTDDELESYLYLDEYIESLKEKELPFDYDEQ